MQALDAIVGVVNKRFLQSLYKKRRGPKGYGLVRIIRLLVFAKAKNVFKTRTMRKYLKNHPDELRKLGFKKIPSRRSISDWKKNYAITLEKTVKLLGDRYAMLRNPKFTLLDSAPLPDSKDPEAKSGKTGRGWFKGFKVHHCCDDQRVPLRAKITTGNVHDSKPAKELFVKSPVTLTDSAYDSQELREEALNKDTILIADKNPRRGKKKEKRPVILKKLRYLIEQSNSIMKGPIMQNAWYQVKGLVQKTTFALTSIVLIQAIAIYTLIKTGEVNLKVSEILL